MSDQWSNIHGERKVITLCREPPIELTMSKKAFESAPMESGQAVNICDENDRLIGRAEVVGVAVERDCYRITLKPLKSPIDT